MAMFYGNVIFSKIKNPSQSIVRKKGFSVSSFKGNHREKISVKNKFNFVKSFQFHAKFFKSQLQKEFPHYKNFIYLLVTGRLEK